MDETSSFEASSTTISSVSALVAVCRAERHCESSSGLLYAGTITDTRIAASPLQTGFFSACAGEPAKLGAPTSAARSGGVFRIGQRARRDEFAMNTATEVRWMINPTTGLSPGVAMRALLHCFRSLSAVQISLIGGIDSVVSRHRKV